MTRRNGSGPVGIERGTPLVERLKTRDEIAVENGVTPGTVHRWTRDGLRPVEGGGRGRQARFRSSEVNAWRIARIEAQYAGQSGLDPRAWRARKDMEHALLAEQLRQRRAGEVLLYHEVEHGWSLVVAAIKSKLQALPGAMAPRLVAAARAATTETEALAVVEGLLRAEVRAVLTELAAWTMPEPATKTAAHRTNGRKP
jgi:phage terminase Nu1 subunit (DNA packaging protein)